MNELTLRYALLVLWGMLLGTIFFGGLWMTVRQMQQSRHPAVLFLGSVVVRTTIVLAGIWFVCGRDAAAMIACLLGFVGLRLLATHGATVCGRSFGSGEAK